MPEADGLHGDQGARGASELWAITPGLAEDLPYDWQEPNISPSLSLSGSG